jgi:YebC/PmpR family DNA-binding regulatory protein
MSGHSKWSNIKNRKGAQDAKRAKDFFRAAKMIRVAIKGSHNGDPSTNPALRLAVEKAHEYGMPKETVQRAINRSLGQGEHGEQVQEIIYEGYGPQGAGFLVVAVTDNVQRTAANIRFLFTRHGGSLSGPGSAMFLFKREGDEFVTSAPLPLANGAAAEVADLYDVLQEDEDVEEVYTNAEWEGKE